jgi:hypothetical protein
MNQAEPVSLRSVVESNASDFEAISGRRRGVGVVICGFLVQRGTQPRPWHRRSREATEAQGGKFP